GDVLEFPLAQVAVKDVGVVQPAKIQVHPSVAIDVSRRNAGAIQADLVQRGVRVRQLVCKSDASHRWWQEREARWTRLRDGQLSASPAVARLPIESTAALEKGARSHGKADCCHVKPGPERSEIVSHPMLNAAHLIFGSILKRQEESNCVLNPARLK